MNNADTPTKQAHTSPPGPSGAAPNTCRRARAQAAGGASSAALPLVYTQELTPPYSPNGSQPSESFQVINSETGEVLEYEQSGKAGILTPKYTKIDHQNTRLERFAMRWSLDSLLPYSRQSKCHRFRIPNKEVELKLSLEHEKAFVAGCEVCGSVWGCPLCAPKITERKRIDVEAGMASAKDKDFQVMLATFTIPHGRGHDLKQIRAQMLKAWRKGSTSRAGQAMRKMIGLRGYIRVVEVTYGANGWHPHFHVLLIVDTKFTAYEIQQLWYPIWLDGCRKSGLEDPSEAHGVRVDDGARAAQYVTKWGMDSELTKGHLKKGKKSVNPWDLLRIYTFGLDGITPELREVAAALGIDKKRAGALWLDFFHAFKGTRQLYWSNGLRDLLGLSQEKTDQELAEEEMDPLAGLLAVLTAYWFDIGTTKTLPRLLNRAEDAPSLIPELLEEIRILAIEKRKQKEVKYGQKIKK